MNQLLIQGIGIIALLFAIFSFQKNKRANILVYMLLSLVLWVVHYIMLGAWTGALMNFIEAGMVFVAYKKETDVWAKQKFWPYVFTLAFIIAGAFTFHTRVDVLPVFAQICGTIAVWQIHPRAIRFTMLLPRPLWFIYNFVVGSYAGMAAEIFIFLSVVIGIVRFDILGRSRVSDKKR